jgi:hypothetical protein
MNVVATALVSALTSVAVVLVSFFLSSRDDRGKAAQAERQELNARYLNPLRLHLAETRFRLAEILLRTEESGRCEDTYRLALTHDGIRDLARQCRDRQLIPAELSRVITDLVAYASSTGEDDP